MGIRDPRPYAKALLGHPYCYGTRGWRMTAANIAAKKKQYSGQVDPKLIPCEGGANPKNIGTDCIGLVCYACAIPDTKGGPMGNSDTGMQYYLKKNGKDGNAFMDNFNAGGARRAWGAKPIGSIPEPTKANPGIAVFIKEKHIGLYLGNGEVIESTPGRVQVTKLKARRTNIGDTSQWDAWAYVHESWLAWAEGYFGIAEPPGTQPNEWPAIGGLVRFQDGRTTYYPGGPALPAWVKTGDPHVITQIKSGGKDVIKGAARCVLLGKRVNLATGKESDGVNTWAAIDFLEKAPAAGAAKKAAEGKGEDAA